MRIASLPMYDLPATRAAHDALWAVIARSLEREGVADVPDRLMHDRPLHELWSDPDLLLTQCCGYDVTNRFAGRLRVVATPRFDAPGCEGWLYSSVIVVASDSTATGMEELRGAVCVVNGFESHSGMNALRAHVAPLSRNGRFFTTNKVSGSHRESLAVVARGEADVAAIDCVTHALMVRHDPEALAGTRQLCRTASAPAVPYVTRAEVGDDDVERLRTALYAAFADPALKGERGELLLAGIEVPPCAAYDRIIEFADFAAGHGYPSLP